MKNEFDGKKYYDSIKAEALKIMQKVYDELKPSGNTQGNGTSNGRKNQEQ